MLNNTFKNEKVENSTRTVKIITWTEMKARYMKKKKCLKERNY